MNSIPVMMLPESETERMSRIREELDAEDDAHWNELVSGRHAAARLRGSEQALAMIAEAPPAPQPVEARRKADEAMAGLVRDYLKLSGGRL